jgi:hypothetical protein
MNLVENLAVFYFLLVSAAVFNPLHAAFSGFTWGFGRLVYGILYSYGAKYRYSESRMDLDLVSFMVLGLVFVFCFSSGSGSGFGFGFGFGFDLVSVRIWLLFLDLVLSYFKSVMVTYS